MTPTLWAGSNNGTVYVFTIAVPGGTKRTEENVICQLGEIIFCIYCGFLVVFLTGCTFLIEIYDIIGFSLSF